MLNVPPIFVALGTNAFFWPMAHTIPSGSLREKSTKEKTDNEWIRIGNLCAYAYTMHTHMYTYILYIIYAPGSLAWLKGTSAGNQGFTSQKKGRNARRMPWCTTSISRTGFGLVHLRFMVFILGNSYCWCYVSKNTQVFFEHLRWKKHITRVTSSFQRHRCGKATIRRSF